MTSEKNRKQKLAQMQKCSLHTETVENFWFTNTSNRVCTDKNRNE